MLGSRLNRCSVKTIWSRINYLLKLSFSTDPTTKALYPLKSRSLVKVGGPEAGQFLQGLITNDIRHLEEGAQSMYAMFLNNKGRVLYDTLVHKWTGENIYMLECDKSVQNLLIKHLKIYKLKRDVQIGDVSHLFKVWALLGTPDLEAFCEPDMKFSMSVYKDPRLPQLGHRLITTTDVGTFDIHSAIGKDTVIKGDEQGYHVLRYSLGVSEGAEDLFPGTCFPLEANCDYLHGISFHKGCYIGQELTARIHHTGVVRKRIMPIIFKDLSNEEELEKDATVWANVEPGRTKVGKIKNRIQDVGLGLVRIKEALVAKSLTVGQTLVVIKKPYWWPKEVVKEKFITFKPEYEEIRDK